MADMSPRMRIFVCQTKTKWNKISYLEMVPSCTYSSSGILLRYQVPFHIKLKLCKYKTDFGLKASFWGNVGSNLIGFF